MHTHDHHSVNDNHQDGGFKILLFAIILILVFAATEFFASLWSGSLALLSDSGHMASDAVSLMIAAFASWISLKPPTYKHSYGLGRAEVVAAGFSSLIILMISIAIMVSAIKRIHHLQPVHGETVIIVGFLGLVVNLFVAWILGHGQKTLNIKSALLHVMSDMLGSIAALIAGAVIYFSGWLLIDPILSILISILIIFASLGLLKETILVLMEGVPRHIKINEVANDLSQVKGVSGVHDLHIWTLSSGVFALSAHINLEAIENWQKVLEGLKQILHERYGIDHVTLQPESEMIHCDPCLELK